MTARIVVGWSKYMLATYDRPPPLFVRGRGSYLVDFEGRKYLDFTSGIAVNALGHCEPTMMKMIRNQVSQILSIEYIPAGFVVAGTMNFRTSALLYSVLLLCYRFKLTYTCKAAILWHSSNLYLHKWIGPLCVLLVEKTKESGAMHDAATVFLCNSGTEANEAAIKFARKSGKLLDPEGSKYEIVSFHGSFHGRTMGALSATPNPKYQEPFAPMLPGCKYGTFNDVQGIDELVTDKTCGVIIEPIQGEGGVNVATDEFLTALAKRCREVGAVLIYDEIQCGLSRTGSFWAHSHLPKEAHPDVITTAKALGNGFPIGAAIINGKVSERMKTGDHGTTFGGNPIACHLGNYVVCQVTKPELLKGVRTKYKLFTERFERMKAQFPDLITEYRGKGLLLGLQLTQDPSAIVKAARERGLLIITCGTNTLRFVPPLTVNYTEIKIGLDILEEAIKSTR